MLGLPRNNIFLVRTDNSRENVMSTDCSTKKEVREETKYLFDKCGYKRENYIKAQYISNNKILYEFSLDELES